MALRSPLTVQPYDYIADSNGRPLDYGQVYIGVANQDPEFYQIPVYLDAAMTKPIDQPIRTNDGFVDFAGSLSELYASAEVYSVKVLDKEGRKVLYKGDMTRKNLMSDALADLNQSIIDTQTAAQITLNAAVNSANTEVAQTVSLATAAIDTATTKSNKAATDADAAIKTLFENGGLPATPFATKALMTASALVDGSYAVVTDDTVNNGLYLKESGAWVKSAYDPVQIADNHTDAKIGTLISKVLQPDLHVFSDSEYNIVAKIDSNSELHLTGLDGSVQENINNPKSLGLNKVVSNVFDMTHIWTDDNDDILMSLRNDGGLMLTDSTVTLQEQIDLHEVVHPRILDPKQMFSDACTPYFLNMSVSGLKNAPVPFGLLPQKYTVPDSIVNAFTVEPPTGYIPIDSPYGANDMVVHPAVIEVRGAFRGYRYLMCINPYSVESHENPVIYGSNSLDGGWEMLTGFYQPLEEPKAGRYFSDSGFSYDPISGMLICFWRDGSSTESGSDQYVKYRATRDGIQWTPTKTLFSITAGTGHLSPSMLFNPNDGLWHFWSGVSPSLVAHYTAKNLDDSWVLAGNGTVSGMWHSEVKFAGDKYLMLVNKRDPASNYRLAISSDGNTWEMGTDLFTIQQDALYKASYITNIKGDELSLDILYTTNHTANPDNKRRLFHVKTNTTSIGA